MLLLILSRFPASFCRRTACVSAIASGSSVCGAQKHEHGQRGGGAAVNDGAQRNSGIPCTPHTTNLKTRFHVYDSFIVPPLCPPLPCTLRPPTPLSPLPPFPRQAEAKRKQATLQARLDETYSLHEEAEARADGLLAAQEELASQWREATKKSIVHFQRLLRDSRGEQEHLAKRNGANETRIKVCVTFCAALGLRRAKRAEKKQFATRSCCCLAAAAPQRKRRSDGFPGKF